VTVCSFTIPYPAGKKAMAIWNKRFGLNAYYAGKHWAKRKEDAKELHTLTRWCMRRAGVPQRIYQGPVELFFWFDDGLDCSNHAVLVKAIEDSLKGWVIEDDSRKFVKGIKIQFHEEGNIKVLVRGLDRDD
jgi:hypothetical protein